MSIVLLPTTALADLQSLQAAPYKAAENPPCKYLEPGELKLVRAGALGNVKQGDTFVVESEGVVGVLGEYAFAVTAMRGSIAEFCAPFTRDAKEFVELVLSLYPAIAEAQRRGYELDPYFALLVENR